MSLVDWLVSSGINTEIDTTLAAGFYIKVAAFDQRRLACTKILRHLCFSSNFLCMIQGEDNENVCP